jgi:Putative MetA-pathway of phenol degradation
VKRLAHGLVALLSAAFQVGVEAQGLMTTPIGFRTGFTEGSVITRPGTLTVDAGTSARWSSGTTTYRVGEFNLRVPLTRRIEARFYANSYAWREGAADVVQGREDLSLGAAAMIVSHRRFRPVTTLILRLDSPTGSLPSREHSWRPTARWALGWELPGRVALHCNLGVASETRSGQRFVREFAVSGCPGAWPAVWELTPRSTG